MTGKITVHLTHNRSIRVRGEARYLGTSTGAPGSPNVERYEVSIRGVVCEGIWDGDSRHDVIVVGGTLPEGLRSLLLRRIKAREARQQRQHEKDRYLRYG